MDIREQNRDLIAKHEKSVMNVCEKVSISNLSFPKGLPLSSDLQIISDFLHSLYNQDVQRWETTQALLSILGHLMILQSETGWGNTISKLKRLSGHRPRKQNLQRNSDTYLYKSKL